ncbi:hypothetical protein HK100_012461 [Physocladia obscura]|uniref:TIR domain-containing protein n=1 Tax=Physocladia obscura TaxID=109957 RepID=A0AAD5XCG0_9FUNG|nr:hypothetical protein HK100_012461 [Physocladia obscura]
MLSSISGAIRRRSSPLSPDQKEGLPVKSIQIPENESVDSFRDYVAIQKQTLDFEKDKFERELEVRKLELALRREEFEYRKKIDEQFLALKQLPAASTSGYNDSVPLTRDIVPVSVDSPPTVSAPPQITHGQDLPPPAQSLKKIFISYSWKNSRDQKLQEIAARKATQADLEKCGKWDPRKHTYDIIKQLGYTPWLDVDQLGVGNALENSLADTLSDDVSIVIVHVSDEYAASTNCRQEFQFATSLNLKIIPLVVGPEMEGQKTKKDSADGGGPSANSSEKIVGKKSGPAQYIDARDENELDTNLKRVADTLRKTVQEIAPITELDQKSSEGYKSIRDALVAKDNEALAEMLKNFDEDLNASVSGAESILNLAVANANIDNLETLINKGLIIDADGQTPLISAIQRNDMDILDLLLRKGANVNAVDFNKNSALHVAAATGTDQQCEMILFHNPKLEEENTFGCTPFLYAVSSINVETVRILLAHNVDQNAIDSHSKGNAINVIVDSTQNQAKEFDIFKILLEAEVPVNLPDENDFTPIQNAVYRGKLDVLKEMAKLPNSAELFSVTNLAITAAKYGKLDILQFLLSSECPAKYDLHEGESDGQSPMAYAALGGYVDIMKFLTDLDKNLLTYRSSYAGTLLMVGSEQPSVIKYLLDESSEKFDITERNQNGHTVMAQMVEQGDIEMVKYLRAKEPALVKIKDNDKNTLIKLAADAGKIDMFKFLISNYAEYFDIHDTNKYGCTALTGAITSGCMEAIKILLDMDSTLVNVKANDGTTALQYATHYNQIDSFNFLLSYAPYKYNLHDSDDDGWTALTSAVASNNIEMMKRLVDLDQTVLNARTTTDLSLLQIATQYSQWEAAKFLLDQSSVKWNLTDLDQSGETVALNAAGGGSVEVLENIAKIAPSCLSFKTSNGTTLPIRACLWGQYDSTLKWLFEQNFCEIDLKAADNDNWNVLTCAINGQDDVNLVKRIYQLDKSLISVVANDSRNLLHFAATSDTKLDIVKFLVERGNLDFNAVDDSGNTPIAQAANSGATEIVKYLLSVDSDLSLFISSSTNQTVIQKAIICGDYVEIVKHLLGAANQPLDNVDTDGETAFTAAISYGRLDCFKHLLKFNPKIIQSSISTQKNLLHRCLNSGDNVEMIKQLMSKAKFDVNALDDNKDTVLSKAIEYGYTDSVKYLLTVPDITFDLVGDSNQTLLHRVVNHGDDLEILKALLNAHKFDLGYLDSDGNSILSTAVSNGYVECVRYIINLDASLLAFRSTTENKSLLHLAVGSSDNVEILKILLTSGKFDVNQTDSNGHTALSSAISFGRSSCVKYLFGLENTQHKLDVVIDQKNLIQLALTAGDVIDIIKLLWTVSEGKFDLNNVDSDGYTALATCVSNFYKESFKFLINLQNVKHNFDITPGDSTLLELAAKNLGSVEIIEKLLNFATFNFSHVDKDGLTALAYAVKAGDEEAVSYLISKDPFSTALISPSGETLVHLVTKSSDYFNVLKIITAQSKINLAQVDNDGKTALYYAVQNSNTKCAIHLIKLDPSLLEFKTSDNQTLLHVLTNISYENLQLLKIMLNSKKFDLHAVGKDGKTPLAFAVENNSIGYTKTLVELDPSLLDFKTQDGSTLLHLSVSYYSGAANIILGEKYKGHIDIYTKDSLGRNAFTLGLNMGSKDFIKLLVKLDPAFLQNNVSNNMTPLELSVWRVVEDVFDYLVSAGSDPTVFENTDKYLSLLTYAAYGGNDSILNKILKKNEEYSKMIDAVPEKEEFTSSKRKYSIISVVSSELASKPLPLLANALKQGYVLASSSQDLDALKILSLFKVQYDPTVEFDQRTALYYASKYSEESIQFLLDLNASDLMASHEANMSAFYSAIGEDNGQSNAAAIFIEKGVDPNLAVTGAIGAPHIAGFTAVHRASQNKRIDALKYLFTCEKVDFTLKDSNGSTSLHILANSDISNSDMSDDFTLSALIKGFVDKGVDVNAVDSKGLTAFDVSKARTGGVVENDFMKAIAAIGGKSSI